MESEHPGEIIKQYLRKEGISQKLLAERLGIQSAKLSRIVNGYCPITTGLALKLEALTQLNARFWLMAQMNYDLWFMRKIKQSREEN